MPFQLHHAGHGSAETTAADTLTGN